MIRVDVWQPDKEDYKVLYDGKLIIIPFDRIFNRESISVINNFFIKKESYSKKLHEITHYINYFIRFYDIENELLFAYLKLKFMIDNKKMDKKKFKEKAFIKALYAIMFSKKMIKMIDHMVEDNYYIDVSSKPNNDRKYAESLEFTNEHAKVMMKISVSMKLMVPVLFQYINTHMADKDGGVDLFPFYQKLFEIYGETIDIYNKLWYSVNVKVSMNYAKNKILWQQREFKGTNELEQVDYLLKDKLISETFFKYSFDKNIINFNSVVMDRQLNYFRIEKYPLVI
jgi:hypothetical protein